MSFNPQTLRSKLAAATEAADSITSTAQWILFYKRHAAVVAEQWAASLAAHDNKLAQIYIANEVIQQSRIKKKAEFVAAFAAVLPGALQPAYSEADLPTRDRIARVIKVWRERLVFTPEAQKEIEAVLNTRAEAPQVHADLRALAQKYAQLQDTAAAPNGSSRKLAEDVLAELALLQRNVGDILARCPPPLQSPDIEPLSPAADTAPPEDEPETYTAQDAAASVASQNDDVGYADSSEDDEAAKPALEEPPAKKPRVDLDPKLSSFLANISKAGM